MAKIYSSWAFTKDEKQKSESNQKAYKELCEKYKIVRVYLGTPKEEIEKADIAIIRRAGYNHSTYAIIKNKPNLSELELALICDNGNLCFGYTMEGSQIYVFED